MGGDLTGSFSKSAPDSIEIPAVFAAPKVAMGRVFKVDNGRIPPTAEQMSARHKGDAIKAQKQRYEDARLAMMTAYEGYIEHAKEHALYEVQDIAVDSLKAELQQVKSGSLNQAVLSKIEEGLSAEAAVDAAYGEFIQRFSNGSFNNKAAVELAQHRAFLQHHLYPDKQYITLRDMKCGSVLVTDSLTLQDLSHLVDPETGERRIEGVIVKEGSLQSHAAILCQAMGIPYAHVSEGDFKRFKMGDILIMDGGKNVVHLSPSPELKERYGEEQEAQKAQKAWLWEKWRDKNCVEMQGGEKFNVHVNYGTSYEAQGIKEVKPRGIGLYRTEMYYAVRAGDVTSVERHKEIMENSMRVCGGGGIIGMTVRTIDLAGDKSDLPSEERGQKEREITYDQMRALAKLKKELGDDDARKLKVMVPNIRDVEHFNEMQALMNKAAEEEGAESIKLGMMVENPGVVHVLDKVDAAFFSVGTNDLYYSSAGLDRFEEASIAQYDPTKPAFLGVLEAVVAAGQRKGIPVSLCGNMASEVRFLPLLIGAGYRDISAGVDAIPMLKELASRIDPQAARALFESIKGTDSREVREQMLAEFNQNHMGLCPQGHLAQDWTPRQEAGCGATPG